MATDPVCGMFVAPSPGALQLVRENRTYYFCSQGCQRSFSEPEQERRRLRRRLVVAWPLSVAVVFLTYGGTLADSALLAAALAAGVQFYPGAVFYRGTYDAVRHRSLNMDVLIAVGTTAAFLYSVAALLGPGGLVRATYFDASSLILTLILTGNYLEHLTRVHAGSALRRLDELLPAAAEVVRGERVLPVPPSEVRAGDRLRVRPGARFAADGLVRSGRSSVDESLMTGESRPVPKGPGDPVLAGSINGEGALEVEATGVGADTFVAQVGRLLTDAEMARVPMQRTADRIGAVFVPAVLLLAVVASVAWFALAAAGLPVALLVFVTVTITACPCAFGLATPAAILVGTGRAADEGILFRGGDALEQAARTDLVLTDKTGTLTVPHGEFVEVEGAGSHTPAEVLALAAGLEAQSEHSLARAVRARAARDGVGSTQVDEVRSDPGRGVRGVRGGRPVAILRGDIARAEGVDLDSAGEAIRRAEARGDSWSAVIDGGRLLGLVEFRSAIAPGVAEGIRDLRSMGVDVVMVTGDSPAAARTVAEPLAVRDVHAGATPARKVELVEDYRRKGNRVAFVGDGINDAAALAAADVGIAIGTGSDVAREAGQVLLVRPDFSRVPVALRLARRTLAKVRGNFAWAIGYNLVLLPIAAGALVPWLGLGIYAYLPIAGALAMGLSSTTVVLNSLSLKREGRAATGPTRFPSRPELPAPG